MARAKKPAPRSTVNLPPFLALQVRSNQEAQRFEALYSGHRAHLSALLLATPELAASPAGSSEKRSRGRVGILGAGNGLDLDGEVLGELFSQVHLVDIDPKSLEGAKARMAGTAARAKLTLHAPIDVTGSLLPKAVQASLDAFQSGKGSASNDPARSLDELDSLLMQGVDQALRALPRFDVVLSDCVLTQTFCTIDAAWPKWAKVPALRQRIMTRHLQLLSRLLVPGGVGLFVTDTTTSETLPIENMVRSRTPEQLLSALTEERCFAGVAPSRVQAALTSAAHFNPPLENRSISAPWLWQVLPERSYLVVAYRFTTPSSETAHLDPPQGL